MDLDHSGSLLVDTNGSGLGASIININPENIMENREFKQDEKVEVILKSSILEPPFIDHKNQSDNVKEINEEENNIVNLKDENSLVSIEQNIENENDKDNSPIIISSDVDNLLRSAAMKAAQLIENEFALLKDQLYNERKSILEREEISIHEECHEKLVEQLANLDARLESKKAFLKARRDCQLELCCSDLEFRKLQTSYDIVAHSGNYREYLLKTFSNKIIELKDERNRLADRLIIAEQRLLMERDILTKQGYESYLHACEDYNHYINEHGTNIHPKFNPPEKPHIPSLEDVLENGYYDSSDALADSLGYIVVPNEYGAKQDDILIMSNGRPAFKSISIKDAEAHRPATYLPFWSWPRNKAKLSLVLQGNGFPVASAMIRDKANPQEIEFDLNAIKHIIDDSIEENKENNYTNGIGLYKDTYMAISGKKRPRNK